MLARPFNACVALCAPAESAEAGRPVLFFCKAGKDRTGLVAAMILTLMGASECCLIVDMQQACCTFPMQPHGLLWAWVPTVVC